MSPDKITNALLVIVSMAGSFAAFTAVQRFFAPREEARSPIGDISDMEGKETSVFSKLENSKNFWDKVDLFFARQMGMEKKLEETYMLLGRPSGTDPLKMLHLQLIAGAALPTIFFALSQSPFTLLFAPMGFLLPGAAIYSGRIRRRQEDIIRNFPTFVDLGALMISAALSSREMAS